MNRSARAAVALALVAVAAGCSAPAVGGGPTPGTDRLTPAPLPEGSPEPLAPGVTNAGIVDANALKEAHIAQLDAGNFTVRRVRVERYANGSLRARTRLTAVFPGDGRYLVERTFEGPVHDRIGTGGTVRQYGDENRTVRLRLAANGSVVERSVASPPGGPVPRSSLLTAPFSGRTVLLVLRAVDFDAATALDDRRGYRLRGSGVADRAALQSLLSPTLVESVRNVSAAAVVTEAGLVEQLRVAYTVDLDGEPVRVVGTVRFSEVGTATLDRPAWAEPRTEATTATGVRSTTRPTVSRRFEEKPTVWSSEDVIRTVVVVTVRRYSSTPWRNTGVTYNRPYQSSPPSPPIPSRTNVTGHGAFIITS